MGNGIAFFNDGDQNENVPQVSQPVLGVGFPTHELPLSLRPETPLNPPLAMGVGDLPYHKGGMNNIPSGCSAITLGR